MYTIPLQNKLRIHIPAVTYPSSSSSLQRFAKSGQISPKPSLALSSTSARSSRINGSSALSLFSRVITLSINRRTKSSTTSTSFGILTGMEAEQASALYASNLAGTSSLLSSRPPFILSLSS